MPFPNVMVVANYSANCIIGSIVGIGTLFLANDLVFRCIILPP